MWNEPAQRISRKALTLWRIYGAIQVGITILVSIGLIVAILLWNWPSWLLAIAAGVVLLELLFSVWLLPELNWKRWRYEVTDQDIELQHGILIVKRTLVPMVRVQHVDTEQGPLLRKYKISTISISTAATVHKIPALDEREAEELRQSISSLARVAEEDV
ncbi:PH domain-containing protein [Halobacillus sp. BBL2006]|uniref:PH domain-containing protein n=1 Tax=Halobacillus sp. BBL2006 TaxID=1543706 RepID=UPI000543EDD8|nr:PH domain-containing protein [Halobacillus sp. BBL2006]KHE67759.1 membrane protein [Halobacillus sp. BBL2006]